MSRLHFFYPENDLALAQGTASYTAPRAAIDLRISGETLPMWYGEPGDKFITQGVPAKWWNWVEDNFALGIEPLEGTVTGLEPCPWGWSLPVRRQMEMAGIESQWLPTNAALEQMRQLSNRRTSLRLAELVNDAFPELTYPAGIECFSEEELIAVLSRPIVIKMPWSSSGRGIMTNVDMPVEEILRKGAGIIGRQGSVIAEPFVDVRANFALLFDYQDCRARYMGLSVFENERRFAYAGNLVGSEEFLRKHLADQNALPPQTLIDTVGEALSEILGNGYRGWLGVDMMADPDGRFAVAELNLRHTMGHLCHFLGTRILASGSVGRFFITAASTEAEAPVIRGRRLVEGSLDLAPADRRLRFILRACKST